MKPILYIIISHAFFSSKKSAGDENGLRKDTRERTTLCVDLSKEKWI
jgi:hypothetical protein